MTDVVEQKKEIFLVTMCTQIINKERLKLIEQANEKNSALEESEKMLLLDHENFKKFFERNKQATQDKIEQASKEANEKNNRLKDIKH